MNSETWVTLQGASGVGRGKHIVFISGDEEYRSEEALPMLAQVMAEHHGFKCSVLFAIDPKTGLVDPNVLDHTPGLHLLDNADMAVMFTRFREWPDADMKHFVDYVFSGRPLLGIRTSTHAFHYKNNPQSPYAKYSCNNKEYDGGFGRQVLGEKWIDHHGNHKVEATRGVPRPGRKRNHPIITGVAPIWCPSDVYTVSPPWDAQVLVDGFVTVDMNPSSPVKPDTPTMPVAWVRPPDPKRGTGRVFCSTMGAAADLPDRSLRRLLVNAMLWCMGMEGDIRPDLAVDPLGRFEPTYFGTRKEPTGKRPIDFVPRI